MLKQSLSAIAINFPLRLESCKIWAIARFLWIVNINDLEKFKEYNSRKNISTIITEDSAILKVMIVRIQSSLFITSSVSNDNYVTQ